MQESWFGQFMRRIFFYMMTFVMVFSIAGCGSDDSYRDGTSTTCENNLPDSTAPMLLRWYEAKQKHREGESEVERYRKECLDDGQQSEEVCQKNYSDGLNVVFKTLVGELNQPTFEACGVEIVTPEGQMITDSDFDKDGVSDGMEYFMKTNPCLPYTQGGNLCIMDGDLDSNGDGTLNKDEEIKCRGGGCNYSLLMNE